MAVGDDLSPSNYVDAADCEQPEIFKSLDEAVLSIRNFVSRGQDWWAQDFVYRVVRRQHD